MKAVIKLVIGILMVFPVVTIMLSMTSCSNNSFERQIISRPDTGSGTNPTPEPTPGQYVDIKLKVPGSLSVEILNRGLDYLKIGSLTVSGPLDDVDLICLEKMAGAFMDGSDKDSGGRLRNLDITSATFIGTAPGALPDKIFSGCQLLRSVKISSNVKIIGEGAFQNCMSLVSIHIPNDSKLIFIGAQAFNSCYLLDSINIPNHLREISDYAFQHCSSLKKVNIPNSVKVIGEAAFANCHNLTAINLPKDIVEIGERMFQDCISLKQIIIPAGVRSIGSDVFHNCPLINVKINIKSPLSSNINVASDAFDYKDNAILYYPKGSSSKYKSDNCMFKKFFNVANIREQ